jgi:hypothetical protein
MISVSLSHKELVYLVALLNSDRQTALTLLAADHFFRPSLLPKLEKAERQAKAVEGDHGAR